MAVRKAITKVTRGNQVTIPKSIREKTGLRIGDVIEIMVDETGGITARKLEPVKTAALVEGGDFGRKHGITERDIIKISKIARRVVFKEEYG